MNLKSIHLLLDAARMGIAIKEAQDMNKEHSSLYKGRSEEELAEFAPYIFAADKKKDFINWIIRKGWGNSWGIFLQSSAPAAEVYRHFRKFLLVKTEDGEELYFRFYDPRVLRIFLPTCDINQLREFFGPIHYFFMEDEDSEFGVQFWLEDGQLKSSRFDKIEINQFFIISSP